MTNYFSHDFDSLNDIKLQEVLMKMGQEGIGIFWCLVEKMFKEDGILDLEKCSSYAFALHTDCTKIEMLIDIIFEKDDKHFWSKSVLKRIKLMKEKSKEKKKAANKRWKNEAKKSSTPVYADAMQMHSTSNAIKTNKIKENKIKKKKENKQDVLSQEDFIKNLKQQFPTLPVEEELEKMKDWLSANGKQKKDYSAFARNWLRDTKAPNKHEGVVIVR